MCTFVCLPEFTCTVCADALELELEVLVSCHVGAGRQTLVLYESSERS